MALIALGIVAWVVGGWVFAVCRVSGSPGMSVCRLLAGLGLASGPLMVLAHVSVHGASVGLLALAFVCGLVEAGRWRREARDTDNDTDENTDENTDNYTDRHDGEEADADLDGGATNNTDSSADADLDGGATNNTDSSVDADLDGGATNNTDAYAYGDSDDHSSSVRAGTLIWGLSASVLLRMAVNYTLAAVLLCTLVSALAPATAWDACVAHLALPKAYVRMDQMQVFEGNAYSAYPHLAHTVYTLCYAAGGEYESQMAGWVFGVLALAAVATLGTELYGRRGGLAAAALLAAAPVYTDQAGSATIDLACTAYTTAAIAALAAWHTHRKPGWLAIAGFLAGTAYGARHTALLVCVILGILLLFTGGRGRWRSATLFGVTALTGAIPWLLRSALLAGNPFFPFLGEWFTAGGPPDTMITALGAHESLRGINVGGLLLFPWNLVMHPEWYDGWSRSPGGLVLALGLPGLLIGGRRVRWIALYTLAGLCAMFFFRQHTRYLLPFLVPFMAIAAGAVCTERPWRRVAVLVFMAGCIFGVGMSVVATGFKLPAMLGFETREAFLTRRVEYYPAFAWANENLAHDRTLLSLDPRSYYLDGASYINPVALTGVPDLSPTERQAWLDDRGIGYVMYPEGYRPTGWVETGFFDRLDGWLEDPTTFREIHCMDLSNPRTGRVDRVRFFEVCAP